MTGIYVHVPFCVSKCPYCDFYSLPLSSVDADMRARYAAAVVREMERYDGVCADTLYFAEGGEGEKSAHRRRHRGGKEALFAVG